MGRRGNGHVPKQAILYTRVSTEEQARSGYSLVQQLEALRAYAAREGYEILEEVSDPGQSGVSLERPGMDRVRDLVANGSVSVVLAQDRDRFAREPAYLYLLKKEFEEYDCKIRALNDRGDDSPEGQLTDGILDQLAKFERAKTAERTRRGKMSKARKGEIVAPRKVAYGFRLNASRNAYVVDEETMPVVLRIFELVAQGTALHTVKRALEADNIPAPSGGKKWNRSTLRYILNNDVYFPHTFEETAEKVSKDVASRLDRSKRYGIWWSTKHDVKVLERVRTPEGGYRDRRSHGLKPETMWIAVPVPDAGVPRETAERARHNAENNPRQTKKEGGRIWELTGGLLYCGECGRSMTPHTVGPKGRKRHLYYRCPRKAEEEWSACPNKHHRAEDLEKNVRAMLTMLFNSPEEVERQVEERIAKERGRDPNQEALRWSKRLEEIDNERKQVQKKYLIGDGRMDMDVLDEVLAELEEERDNVERELEAARNRQERLRELENDRIIVLGIYAGLATGDLSVFPPEERRRIYRALGLKATIDRDGRLEVEVAGSDFIPDTEEARRLVEGVIYDPKRQKARQEMRALMDERIRKTGRGHLIPEERRGVMSSDKSSSPPCTQTTPPAPCHASQTWA